MRIVILVLGVLLLGACQEPKPSTVQISLQQDPAPFNEPFAFVISLDTSVFRDIQPKDLNVEAIMPAHGHGMNVQPIITPMDEAGNFLAEGAIFHMRGKWQIQVYITSQGSVQKATMNLEI